MHYKIIIIITCLANIACFGQDSVNKNSLAVHFGPGFMMRQDMIFSPFIHKDLSLINVGISYIHEANFYKKLNFRYGNFDPMVTAPYQYSVHGDAGTAYPHSFNMIDLDYLFGKPWKVDESSSLTVGGILSADVQAINYVYGRISSFGYYSAFGLGLFGQYRLDVSKKNSLAATLQLPLVIWLSRPPFIGIDDEFIENISSHSPFKTFGSFVRDGNLITWNKLQTFDSSIDYTYKLNENWEIAVTYLFEFIHSTEPQNLLSFRNSLVLSATTKF